MVGGARKKISRKPVKTSGLRSRTQAGNPSRAARYSSRAWPANDNKPPAWRGALAWALVGMGIGGFAFVAVSLLL
jgi:hypothetical protein